MSRKVVVLVGVELEDFVEVEVVDYDNRNCNYQMWAHEDGTFTLSIEIDGQKLMFRRTRDAMREVLTGVLGRLDTLKAREEPERIAM